MPDLLATRARRAPALIALAFATALAACGEPKAKLAPLLPVTDPVDESPGLTGLCANADAGAVGAPSTSYPAFEALMPQVPNAGGVVLAAPRVQPVFFAGEDEATMGALVGFLDGLDSLLINGAPYWSATTHEYGVGPVTTAKPIALAESAPAEIADSQIRAWIQKKLDGDDPAFPKPDENTIYALFYPEETSIRLDLPGASPGTTSCKAFGGYHASTTLDAAHGALEVAYAVLPRCPKLMPGADVVDVTMMVASHELIEAATDPHPLVTPAFFQVDDAHFAWEVGLGGGELADLCAAASEPVVKTPSAWVQRTWSNAAAAAGHDPCVPAAAGSVYFNSIPILPDTVAIALDPQEAPVMAAVARVPAGQSKTIELDLSSDGDTGGPWAVTAFEVPLGGSGTKAKVLSLCLDALRGSNGQKLHLTISVAAAAPPSGAELFVIESTLGATTNLAFGLVTN